MDNRLKANVWKSYAIQILARGVSFYIPIIVLFWQRSGLTFSQIALLQTAFSICIVILELPSGYLADKVGRRNTLIIASLSLTLGMLIYSTSTTFHLFLLAEILLATGYSFISGTDSALLYETLLAQSREKQFKEIWGRIVFYSLIFSAVATIVGGVIGSFNLRSPFYIATVCIVLIVPLAISIQNTNYIPITQVTTKRSNFNFGNFRQGLQENKSLIYLLTYSTLILSINQVGFWYYQPYFETLGINVGYFGVILAFANIVTAFSARLTNFFEEKMTKNLSMMLPIVLSPLSYFLLAGSARFSFSFVFIFIQQFNRGFGKVLFADRINSVVRTDNRSTILSLQNLMTRLFFSILILVSGYIYDRSTIIVTLFFLGTCAILISLSSLSVYLIRKKRRITLIGIVR